MNPGPPTIGVFDSGVGGLSILNEIRKLLPGCDLLYYCDNKNFPYGTKSEADVRRYVEEAYRDWVKHQRFDVLIIACNTASTLALDDVRALSTVPVVGVVPAIKPAATRTKTGVIGLLATPGTISRQYTKNLIEQFAADKTVIQVGSTRLVEIAEEKLRALPVSTEEIAKVLRPFFENDSKKIDQLVLGCTHFPLLREEIAIACPWPVSLVDSSPAIAARVVDLLGGTSQSSVGALIDFRFSSQSTFADELVPAVKSMGFTNVSFSG